MVPPKVQPPWQRLIPTRRCIVARASRMLTFALALAACSSMKVQTEYDRTADFKGYRTYAWLLQQPGPEQAPEAATLGYGKRFSRASIRR